MSEYQELCGNTVEIDKHQQVVNAIENIQDIFDSLNNLLDRIEGNPVDEKLNCKTQPLSLQELLKEGGGIINNKVCQCLDTIEQITNKLF